MPDQLITIGSTRPDPRQGRVLISVEKEYEDEVRIGDTTLKVDTSYRPLHHVQEFGTVEAPPSTMPEWWAGSPCEVKAGDRVRFRYLAICPANLVEHDGRRYWLVPYQMLYYIERPDGSVQLLNDRVLVEPILTAGGEERTAAGLITNLDATQQQRPVARRGRLRHRPAGCPIPLGSEVYFEPNANETMRVGDETLYLMNYQEDITAWN